MMVNTHLTQRYGCRPGSGLCFLDYQSQVVLYDTLGTKNWPSQAGEEVAKLVV